MRNFLATLMFSQGTPMLLAGDEFARTQRGNNNAYAQDNEISWIDWGGVGEEGWALQRFTKAVIQIRNEQPILRRRRFLTGAFNAELDVKDVTWLNPSGGEMEIGHWQDANARCLGMLLDGRAQPTGLRRRGTDKTLLTVLNAYHDVVKFKLPEVAEGQYWSCLVDTNQPDLEEPPRFDMGHEYEVTGRSLLLFELKRPRLR
jgi:glycogen operon protein